MPRWTVVPEEQWVYVDDDDGILAAVNKLGPYLGQARAVYRITGPLVDEPVDLDTLPDARREVERRAAGGGPA